MKDVKLWRKEEIRYNMELHNAWLYRGLLAIYDRQTEDEKASDLTKHENMVGFNGVDSVILSSYAKSLKEWGRLTPKQIAICRKKMLKYAGQLAKIANKEI